MSQYVRYIFKDLKYLFLKDQNNDDENQAVWIESVNWADGNLAGQISEMETLR